MGVAIARQKLDGKAFSDTNELQFNVIDVCDLMGWNSGIVKREMKSLVWESGESSLVFLYRRCDLEKENNTRFRVCHNLNETFERNRTQHV